jgi:hypothetical protein
LVSVLAVALGISFVPWLRADVNDGELEESATDHPEMISVRGDLNRVAADERA